MPIMLLILVRKLEIHGGEIVSEGTSAELKHHNTLTANYLNGTKKIEIP